MPFGWKKSIMRNIISFSLILLIPQTVNAFNPKKDCKENCYLCGKVCGDYPDDGKQELCEDVNRHLCCDENQVCKANSIEKQCGKRYCPFCGKECELVLSYKGKLKCFAYKDNDCCRKDFCKEKIENITSCLIDTSCPKCHSDCDEIDSTIDSGVDGFGPPDSPDPEDVEFDKEANKEEDKEEEDFYQCNLMKKYGCCRGCDHLQFDLDRVNLATCKACNFKVETNCIYAFPPNINIYVEEIENQLLACEYIVKTNSEHNTQEFCTMCKEREKAEAIAITEFKCRKEDCKLCNNECESRENKRYCELFQKKNCCQNLKCPPLSKFDKESCHTCNYCFHTCEDAGNDDDQYLCHLNKKYGCCEKCKRISCSSVVCQYCDKTCPNQRSSQLVKRSDFNKMWKCKHANLYCCKEGQHCRKPTTTTTKSPKSSLSCRFIPCKKMILVIIGMILIAGISDATPIEGSLSNLGKYHQINQF